MGVAVQLVRIDRPILRIPTLAVHLSRENGTVSGFKFNLQSNFPPLLATAAKDALLGPDWQPQEGEYDAGASLTTTGKEKHHPLLLTLLSEELGCTPAEIADFELQLCDTQPAQIGGALDEFIFSGRLDNLANCYCSVKALIDSGKTLADEPNVRILERSSCRLLPHFVANCCI
jgi:aspartyl aminopeptidase